MNYDRTECFSEEQSKSENGNGNDYYEVIYYRKDSFF